MSETRTPSEWCSLLDWHILDPDGWREDGLSWFEPITREDFERRAAMSTARGPRAGSSVPEAARAAAIGAAERQVRYVKAIRWTDVAGNWDVEFAADRCMALADVEVAAASVELQQEVDRLSAECEALRGTVAEERATTARRIEAALALCQDANGYTTHDQIEKLGEPPWHGMDANLVAWERAHGHDVRLSCDRTDCLLLIDPEDLRAALASPGEGE